MMEEASFVDPHQPSILSFISFNPMAENMIWVLLNPNSLGDC
jgi:hypothetical protein